MAYITVADLKAEGLVIGGEAGVEERVNRLIRLASSWIEVATGQWFESREFAANAPMLLDGTGTKTLALHVPIIEIESVTLDDDELDCEEDYVVYNRRSPDDRGNPKIVLTSGRWTKGNQNVALVGSFGYTDLVDGDVARGVTVLNENPGDLADVGRDIGRDAEARGFVDVAVDDEGARGHTRSGGGALRPSRAFPA